MTLRRKFLLRNLIPLVGLLLMGAAALWGLLGLRADVADSLAGAQELGRIDEVGKKLAAFRQALPPTAGDPEAQKQAADALAVILPDIKAADHGDWRVSDAEPGAATYGAVIRWATWKAADRLKLASGLFQSGTADQHQQAIQEVEQAQRDLGGMVGVCQKFIQQCNQRADRHLKLTLLVLVGLSVTTVAASGLGSLLQYRGVMVPLERLRDQARKVAAAEFDGRLDESGDKEFADLAAEFNRMAAELNSFYHELEEKVLTKSRELVRSERLASVGFLAAGVAHEINNPLNIISGYAELTARRLGRPLDPAAGAESAAESVKCLNIIRDEAFRCKDITDKLLSLTKGGDDNREPLSLADVAREVAEMTKGLKNYRDRRLRLRLPPDEPLAVVAQRTEMKQVLLNLTVNALEAVKPGVGEVCIEGRRNNGWVELRVRDNGRGMGPDTLKHVFEPFFTEKKCTGVPGTGLGLSITHAIVENHGGRIRAESGGVGQGSLFTVQIPAGKAHDADAPRVARVGMDPHKHDGRPGIGHPGDVPPADRQPSPGQKGNGAAGAAPGNLLQRQGV